MRRRQVLQWSGAASVLCAVLLAGCEMPGLPSGIQQAIPYSQVGEPEFWTDPQTGKRIRITHWRYADGYTTVTIDDVTGSGNDMRRNGSEPPIRLVD